MKLMVDGNESEAAKFDMTVSILFNYKANFTTCRSRTIKIDGLANKTILYNLKSEKFTKMICICQFDKG